MQTRNIVLTDHQSAFIKGLVSAGRYQNASEVLRAGLRLVERQEAECRAYLEALREAVHVGIADIEAGRFREFSEPGSLRNYLLDLAEQTFAEESSDTNREQ